MPNLNIQNGRNSLTAVQKKRATLAFEKLPVFPNWFPFNDMVFDGYSQVGEYAGVKTRSWNWDYRGPVLFYNSLRTAKPAVKAYGYENGPSNHKVIIGVGNLIDVRPLTLAEAKQMLANFNKLPLAEVERIVRDCEELDFSPENVVYRFYNFGPYIAPLKIGFFFQNLNRFSNPVPFDWPAGPIKPIYIPVSKVAKELKEVGIDPKTLLTS